MPTKHIDPETWEKVEKAMMDAIVTTKQKYKDSEFLALLLEKGLENVDKTDYWELAKKKENNRGKSRN